MVNHNAMLKASIAIHTIQAVFSIVIMGVIGTGMAQEGSASGASRFVFAMCWLNIPTIIYLTMSPRFTRTKMLAHPYWLLGMNTLYSIFWFAGFVALAVYTNKGISEGLNLEKDPKKKEAGGCAVFFAGTGENEKACQMNKSAVGLGVFMWVLWLTTTAIAGYAGWYFNQHRCSPFDDYEDSSRRHTVIQETETAFASDAPRPYDSDVDGSDNPNYGYGGSEVSHNGYGGSAVESNYSSSSYADGSAHPGVPKPWGSEPKPYGNIAPIAPAHGESYSMPDAPDDYSYRGGR
ncbi:hypothetical protein BZA77DRAFT_123335 [Pyronema omphalodes]|nr:hypothetical protein BZA77DRAFT_123335 [Pyronema omphalodes]